MDYNKSITNKKVYFFTYRDIVLIYKKYPDFLYERHLFLRSYSNSYYYCLGSKTYLINPRNPKHFITDITNTPEEIEFNQKMNEAASFLKRTHYSKTKKNQRDFKPVIPLNPNLFLKDTLTPDQFRKVCEVVPEIQSLDYLFSNQKETYIQVNNLIYIINPLNKDELITKTSITSLNILPNAKQIYKIFNIPNFSFEIKVFIDKEEYIKLYHQLQEDQEQRRQRMKGIYSQKELLDKLDHKIIKKVLKILKGKTKEQIQKQLQYFKSIPIIYSFTIADVGRMLNCCNSKARTYFLLLKTFFKDRYILIQNGLGGRSKIKKMGVNYYSLPL